MGGPNMDDYVDVNERIVEFRTKHPEGSLQQRDVQFIDFAGKSWVVFTAQAYRSPDDPRPGEGTAWEPVPGLTPFTRGSEVQNAETAAWGRAIVAALAADTRRGIASRQEVRNRAEDRRAQASPDPAPDELLDDIRDRVAGEKKANLRGRLFALLAEHGITDPDVQRAGMSTILGREVTSRGDLTDDDMRTIIAALASKPKAGTP